MKEIINIYITFNFIACLIGLLLVSDDHNICFNPPPRIIYVLPLYKVGCWLGEVPK